MTPVCLRQIFYTDAAAKSSYHLKSRTLSPENQNSKDLTMTIAPVLGILYNFLIAKYVFMINFLY